MDTPPCSCSSRSPMSQQPSSRPVGSEPRWLFRRRSCPKVRRWQSSPTPRVCRWDWSGRRTRLLPWRWIGAVIEGRLEPFDALVFSPHELADEDLLLAVETDRDRLLEIAG